MKFFTNDVLYSIISGNLESIVENMSKSYLSENFFPDISTIALNELRELFENEYSNNNNGQKLNFWALPEFCDSDDEMLLKQV